MCKDHLKKKNDNSDPSTSPAITNFPSPLAKNRPILTYQEKIDIIASHFKNIMETLGLDLEDDSLKKTPERVARMYVEEVFSGLKEENFPKMSFFKDEFHHQHAANMVFLKVGFTSFCEHHFVPMKGYAYVAYIPDKQLIGLSKIPRLVRFFSRRPQLQERLTAQIADSLALLIESENVAVSVNARHYCVMARGIQDENSHTITNVLRGEFDSNEKIRKEFFEGINRRDLD